MITRLTVDHFKALRHVEVDLAPFTVLIGANDTGKTSLLESAYALASSTRTSLERCFWSPWQGRELVYQHTQDASIRFCAELAPRRLEPSNPSPTDDRLVYSLSVSFSPGHSCSVAEEWIAPIDRSSIQELPFRKNQGATSVYLDRDGGVPEPVQQLLRRVAEALPLPTLARWDIEELAMPSRLPEDRPYPFDPSGYGLATCIAEMKLGRGGHFEALRDNFCQQFPAFQDLIIKRGSVPSIERDVQFQKQPGNRGEGYALVFLRKDGVEIPAGLASGGTLVTLAFLTLIHLQVPRKLLLIEEPENALHPGRLKEVVHLLRRAVGTRDDCQVIVTTHSPLLLDYVEPGEVRVFHRDQENIVEVYNVADVPDIQERLKYLMLGELVYNEGEQELIKEIQQYAHAHPGRGGD